MPEQTTDRAALQAEYDEALKDFYELDELYEASKARLVDLYNRLCIAMGQPDARILPPNVIPIEGETNYQLWVQAEQIPAAERFTPPAPPQATED